MKSALGARKQPLILSCTTAGYINDGIYDELMKRSTRFLMGDSKESRLLPFLYMIDDPEKWNDINELRKSNPNLGVSVSVDYMLEEIAVAEDSYSKKAEFLTKYCNIKQNSSQAWLDTVTVAWNNRQIQAQLVQGILQGESIPKIARRMRSVQLTNLKASIRYARTMTTAAENAGRIDSYKRSQDMGIDLEPAWMATLDSRTRDSHRALDGETRDPKTGKFSNGCRYPGDPECPDQGEVWNCRCTLVAQIKGFENDFSDMRWRNTDKLGGMSYEEWKNEHKRSGAAGEADYLIRARQGTSAAEKRKASKVILSATAKLPKKVQDKFVLNVVYETGYSNSACDIANKIIHVGIDPTEEEIFHEYGHLIEAYMLDEKKVNAYKRSLVEGKSVADIIRETYYDNKGNEVSIFCVNGDEFESEYQSRLYVDEPQNAVNADGTIKIEFLAEAISECFRKIMMGEEVSQKAQDLLKEILD